MEKAHKRNTENFDELTYAEQSSSITAQINNLSRQIKAHVRRAKKDGKENPLKKNIESVKRMLTKLEG